MSKCKGNVGNTGNPIAELSEVDHVLLERSGLRPNRSAVRISDGWWSGNMVPECAEEILRAPGLVVMAERGCDIRKGWM